MDSSITQMAVALIGVIIIFSISIAILGNITSSFKCDTLPGYLSTGSTDAEKYPTGTYAGLCQANNANAVSSIGLVIISVVILAAAVIMYAVRYLQS